MCVAVWSTFFFRFVARRQQVERQPPRSWFHNTFNCIYTLLQLYHRSDDFNNQRVHRSARRAIRHSNTMFDNRQINCRVRRIDLIT